MRRLRPLLLVSLVAIGLTARAALAVPSPQPPDRVLDAACLPKFHHACSEAMGRWLPTFGSGWWKQSTHIDRRDRFNYSNGHPLSSDRFEDQGPHDGTFFVYGTAGPPNGNVVYDPIHRVAFYQQACCSWSEVVAASGVPKPPKPVLARDLSALATVRGVRLGQTEVEVMKIYGSASEYVVDGHPGVRVLAYTTAPAHRSGSQAVSDCGQTQNFFFRDNRLILIQLGDGC